jgi:hypothetical protein
MIVPVPLITSPSLTFNLIVYLDAKQIILDKKDSPKGAP